MKRVRLMPLVVLALTALTMITHSSGLPTQNTGTSTTFGIVQGRVIDERGDPLPNAKVYAEPVEANGSTGKMHFAITKQDGSFSLDEVVTGMNVICASKEEALFPDTGAAAFALSLNALPRVRVQEGRVTPDVTVQLTKGGKLTGSISDSSNGQPVAASRIRLSRIDDPTMFVSTGPDEAGHFEFVVPSKPFTFEVTAASYRSYEYPGPLLVETASTKEITVHLQRSGTGGDRSNEAGRVKRDLR